MALLNGKWALYSSEKFDEYMKAIGVDDENRAKGVATLNKTGAGGLVEEYVIDSDKSIKRQIYVGGQLVKESPAIPFGKEVSGPSLDGRTVKLTLTRTGPGQVTRNEQFDNGVTSTTVIEANRDELVSTLTAGGVTSVRKYKKV